MTNNHISVQQGTLFGHPTGLFTLFFAEMWERFSYYGMRALLVFYMMKGFLGYGDNDAYAVYGAYTALVYMTPFFGGLIADKILGARKAVVLGGLLMATGHLVMTIENTYGFFLALALLIVGNGFFKPNISSIVGTLYPKGSPKRDGGFTIFYMGVNLGAAMSPLLCGYIGETYGWHYGFGLATIGMLIGLAVFVMPTLVTQVLIMFGSVCAAVALFILHPDNPISTMLNVFVGIALLAAGTLSTIALSRGGLPNDAGRPRNPELLRKPIVGPLSREWLVYIGTGICVVMFVLFVSGFSIFNDGKALTIIPSETIETMQNSTSNAKQIAAVALKEMSRPAGLVLMLSGLLAFLYLGFETIRLKKIARERMFVVLILTFFSMLFWAFFEQAGSSVNNFTDRNVDRVTEEQVVDAADVGQTLTFQPTQEQLGYRNGVTTFTLTVLDDLRKENEDTPEFEIEWEVSEENVGMGIATRKKEVPASTFQAFNPIFILVFGLIFTALWTILGNNGWEPSTPVKFSMGLLQLGLGFGAFWYGAQCANDRGMVFLGWLALGYMFQTTGELCLSPVGLSMVTKLSPTRLVSTVMGAWFLATAFSQLLAAIIAQFTGVSHNGGDGSVPIPLETVHIYGDVFGKVAISAFISAAICFCLSPLLKKWMHESEEEGA